MLPEVCTRVDHKPTTCLRNYLRALSPRRYVDSLRREGRASTDKATRQLAAKVYGHASEILSSRVPLSDAERQVFDLACRTTYGEAFLLGDPTPRYLAYTQLHVLDLLLGRRDRQVDLLIPRVWRAIRVLLHDQLTFEMRSLVGLVEWSAQSASGPIIRARIQTLDSLLKQVPEVEFIPSPEAPPETWEKFLGPAGWESALTHLTCFPQSKEHDEYLFLRTIHVTECCFIGILATTIAAVEMIRARDFQAASRQLQKGLDFAEFLTPLFQAMKTMPPEHFRMFRGATGKASAIQSRNYQLAQIHLQGIDDSKRRELLANKEVAPLIGVYDTPVFRSLQDTLTEVEHEPSAVVVVNTAQKLDRSLYQWRALHLGIARKYLADLPRGTGDTDGPPYLEKHYRNQMFPLQEKPEERREEEAHVD